MNNSIINTNSNKKSSDKLLSSGTILKQNFSTINNNTIGIQNNFINRTKILPGLNSFTYSSRTVDRKDIKDSNSFNKLEGILNINNLNNSKDDININNITSNYNTYSSSTEKIRVNVNNDMIMSQMKKDMVIPQTLQEPQSQVNKEENSNNNNNSLPETNNNSNNNNDNSNNNEKKDEIKNEIKNNINVNKNINSDIQEFINKNIEEDKKRVDFLKEYKEILENFGNNLNQNENK